MATVHRITTNDGTTAVVNFLTGVLRVRNWQVSNTGDGFNVFTFELVARDTDANITAAVQNNCIATR